MDERRMMPIESRAAVAAPARVRMERRGFTLMEMLMVIVLIGAMTAFALPRLNSAMTQQNVSSARVAFVGMYAKARYTAIQRGSAATLILANNVVSIQSTNPVTNVTQMVGNSVNLGTRYGVTVQPASSTWQFDPRGLGTGASQTSVSITKGTYATQIVISAAGRVIQ